MKLYVATAPPGSRHRVPASSEWHDISRAYRVWYVPELEVIHSYGLGMLPDMFNQTPGQREVKRLTGNTGVPVLVKDDGSYIQGSREIADWARANPASAAA